LDAGQTLLPIDPEELHSSCVAEPPVCLWEGRHVRCHPLYLHELVRGEQSTQTWRACMRTSAWLPSLRARTTPTCSNTPVSSTASGLLTHPSPRCTVVGRLLWLVLTRTPTQSRKLHQRESKPDSSFQLDVSPEVRACSSYAIKLDCSCVLLTYKHLRC
jgi:hypothetical protein